MKSLGLAASLLLLMASAAYATVGGPAFARVLGWEPNEQKLFVSIIYNDDSGAPQEVVYFDLGQPGPWKPHVAQWSLQSDDHEAHLATLLRRLRPLDQIPAPTIPRWTRILKADSVRTMYDFVFARYHIQFGALDYYSLEMTTVREPRAAVSSMWAIPKRPERLAIVSAFTQPLEEGYETQTPVIIASTGDGMMPTVQVQPIAYP